MAERVGVDQTTISRLIDKDGKKHVRRPSLGLAARIMSVTAGQVTANDFLDPPCAGDRDEHEGEQVA